MSPLLANLPDVASWQVFIHFPIMLIIFNLVFSATRFDDGRHIIRHAGRGMIYIITFLGGVFLFLFALDWVVTQLFG
jgi:TM2 domain-containing membrane protein YozV